MAGLRYSERTKTTILNDIKRQGLAVAEAAKKYQVSPKTIYSWLNAPDQLSGAKLLAENRQLKRELESSLRIIKRLAADSKKIVDPLDKTRSCQRLLPGLLASFGHRSRPLLQAAGSPEQKGAANGGRDQSFGQPASAPSLLGRQKAGICSGLVA